MPVSRLSRPPGSPPRLPSTTTAGIMTVTLDPPLQHAYHAGTVRVRANVAVATHGETVEQVLGSGDGRRAFASFALRRPPLTFVRSTTNATGAVPALEVRVEDVEWTRVDSLFDAGPRDQVYVVRQAESGQTTVIFGDGVHGSRLPTGARERARVLPRRHRRGRRRRARPGAPARPQAARHRSRDQPRRRPTTGPRPRRWRRRGSPRRSACAPSTGPCRWPTTRTSPAATPASGGRAPTSCGTAASTPSSSPCSPPTGGAPSDSLVDRPAQRRSTTRARPAPRGVVLPAEVVDVGASLRIEVDPHHEVSLVRPAVEAALSTPSASMELATPLAASAVLVVAAAVPGVVVRDDAGPHRRRRRRPPRGRARSLGPAPPAARRHPRGCCPPRRCA